MDISSYVILSILTVLNYVHLFHVYFKIKENEFFFFYIHFIYLICIKVKRKKRKFL